MTIFCFYCWQIFETEKELNDHQGIHFKCQECTFINPQLPSLVQLKNHYQNYHKKPLQKIPNSIPEMENVM